jgi:tRNA-2-methylthio-N6-dimethylallyladenosine synthase
LLGRTVEVLVAVGEGRKDERTGRLSGRARDGRLVHFAAGGYAGLIRPGDIVETVIDYAAPHHLNADAEPVSHRRTRAGDAYEAGRSPRTGGGVLLGLPTVGAPPPVPAAAASCDR